MKIILLYGPGEVNKRAQMLAVKQRFPKEAVFVYDLSLNQLADIDLDLKSLSLFETSDKLIIVENTPDGVDLKKLVKQNNTATILFLAASPKPTARLLSSAKEINAKVMKFEAEQEILAFPFLDNLIEGKKEAFGELHRLLNAYGGMYILFMIYYLLRRNLLPLPQSAFMQKKIKTQQQKMTIPDWQTLYLMVLKTDFDIKSGNLPEPLALTKLTQEFIRYFR